MYRFRLAWRSSRAVWAQPRPWSQPVYGRMFTSGPILGEEDKQAKIIRLLQEKFEPSDLQVQDVSGMYTASYLRWLRLLFCDHDQVQGICRQAHRAVAPHGESGHQGRF